jgi:hypothetical protein
MPIVPVHAHTHYLPAAWRPAALVATMTVYVVQCLTHRWRMFWEGGAPHACPVCGGDMVIAGRVMEPDEGGAHVA